MKRYVVLATVLSASIVCAPLSHSNATASEPVPPPVVVEAPDPADPMIVAPGSAVQPSSGAQSLLGTSRCGSSAYAPPGGAVGPDSRASCSLAGSPGFRTGYTWQMQTGSSTRVCASGLGYNSAYAPVWYGVGCGGSGGVNVPWGNVLAYQKLHAYSINGYGGNVNWY